MSGHHAQTTVLDDGIVAIDTEYTRPLLDASHLIVESGRAAFVDTGVNSSVPLLLDALLQQDLDVGDVDYVFLTHVHLDHAGGAGLLMQQLPNASCVVHRYGAPHMIDPAKLVAGAEAVYGQERMVEMYGSIEPIDERRVFIPDDEQWFELHGRALQTINTEGHARHHYVLNDPQSRGVFTGDSFGVSYRELDTARGEIVFPTSTPVQFDPAEAHKAVDRIMACEPQQLYLTHYSRVRNLDRLAAEMHEGIDAYVAMAREHQHEENRIESLRTTMFEYCVQRLAAHGYSGDRETMHSVLDIDVDLNSQGLEVWLERGN
ncbi:MAG: MBL fold metallo-hydrolase [Gammaproteobacteria bacterium]|nr:MBL fold metallo-hydrolase [Gammaproteobacteria bacterium]MDH3749245.1 MBL fold metallo-hydrolase [Gammaproteobacteria bacterium]MDH3805291.1 MBL fold metallo-hydrolase [Gammaproteobacteria bacterium]